MSDEPATLRVGDINRRLHPLKIDAAGLAELGFQPAKVEAASKLYKESQFADLLRAIARHVEAVGRVPA